jgi:hypothetical protein
MPTKRHRLLHLRWCLYLTGILYVFQGLWVLQNPRKGRCGTIWYHCAVELIGVGFDKETTYVGSCDGPMGERLGYLICGSASWLGGFEMTCVYRTFRCSELKGLNKCTANGKVHVELADP